MTLEEAITHNNSIKTDYEHRRLFQKVEAIQIGIEALEIIEEIRVANGLDAVIKVIWDKVFKLLPSEIE